MSENGMPVTPYKGLIPYSEEDAPFFFGRDPEREIITANLMASRLTLLYGASGVGKSSVLRAGVTHALRKLARQKRAKRGKPEFAVVVFNRWRDNPRAYLEREVLKSVADAFDGRPPDAGQMPNDFVEMLRINTDRVGGRLLIILDQFEEYFLYHAQEDGPGTFAVDFPRAINDPSLRVDFMISIREDALAKLDRFEASIPNLFDNYLRIEHLDREAARDAIVKPVEEFNRRHADAAPVRIEPALIEAVLDQVKTGQVVIGETGRGTVTSEDDEATIETPFLQLVMTRLWQEEMRAGSRVLRLETLRRLGGAERIVKTHLDEAMAEMDDEDRDVAARIFRYLVTPSGTKIAYSAADLADYGGLRTGQLESMLEKLSASDARILRPVAPPLDQPNVLRYEIFHDVLAPAILDWRTRYAEVQKRTETERQLELEAHERARAEERLEREQRLVRQQRWLLALMAIMLLAMLAAAAFAFQQKASAESSQSEAEKQRIIAQDALGKVQEALGRVEAERNEKEKQRGEAEQASNEAQQAAANEAAERDRAIAALKLADEERGRAERQATETRLANANLLATQAKDLIPTRPQRSLLLAVEALKTTQVASEPPVPAAGEALREALSQSGGHILSGHKDPVVDVAVSPDNHWLVSISSSQTLLWNIVPTSRDTTPIALQGGGGPICFSSDNRWLVIGSGNPKNKNSEDDSKVDSTASVWDLNDLAARPSVLRGHGKPITTIVISPDNNWLVTGSIDGTIRLWNLKAKDIAAKSFDLSGGEKSALIGLKISPDSQWLITSNGGSNYFPGTARLWNLTATNPADKHFDIGGHKTAITGLTFSPDSHWLVTSSSTCGQRRNFYDPTAQLWNLERPDPSTAPVKLSGHAGPIGAVAFSSDSQNLVTSAGGSCGEGNPKALVWRLTRTGVAGEPVGLDGLYADSLAITSDNRWLVTFDNSSVRLWDLTKSNSNSKPISLWEGKKSTKFPDYASISPDNRWLIIWGSDNIAYMWDLTTEDPSTNPRILRGHDSRITSVAFSADNSQVVTGSEDKNVRLWSLTAAMPIADPTIFEEQHLSLYSISPDRHWMVIVGNANLLEGFRTTARLYNLTAKDPTANPIILPGHNDYIESIAFSPDSHWLATGSSDKTVRVWNLTAANPTANPQILRGHKDSITSVAFSPNQRWLVTGSWNGTVRLWQFAPAGATGKFIQWPEVETDPANGRINSNVSEIYISPDSHWMITTGSSLYTTSLLWDLTDANPAAKAHILDLVDHAAFSHDSRWLVTGGRDKVTRLYKLTAKDPITSSYALQGTTGIGAFSTDSHWLATSGTEARLWDLSTFPPEPHIKLGNETNPAVHIAFTSDNRWLITSNNGGLISLRELKNLTSKPLILISPDEHFELAVSPDSHWLVTSSVNRGGNIRLWDLKNLVTTPFILPTTEDIRSSPFTKDGHWFITGSRKTVSLWNMQWVELMKLACHTAGRNLTHEEWKKYFPRKAYKPTCPDLPSH